MEIWKDIEGYEGLYQISNFGNVKSFKCKNGKGYGLKYEHLLSPKIYKSSPYKFVILTKNNKRKNHTIHTLVWDHFADEPRNGRILQIDHIKEGDKGNNHIDNLQLLTPRENSSKGKLKYHKTSKYTGVFFDVNSKNWVAYAKLGRKVGYREKFNTEEEARQAYLNFINNLAP